MIRMNRMNRTVKILGWAMLGSLVIGVALVATAVWTAGAVGSTVIQINGEPISLAQLDAGHGLVAIAGIALAMLVVLLVVPLALLLPLAIVVLLLAGALLAVAGVVAMVFSPPILLGIAVWLMVRLIRRDGANGKADGAAKRGPDAGAAIPR